MKKLALVIGLVVILVGLVMGGMALHANASAQTLKAWGSNAPGTVTITGTNWTKAVPVALYMDSPPEDFAHQVAVATPGSNGVFTATFTVGPTSVGDHHIKAVQTNPPNPTMFATATFTITNTSQVDPNILGLQQDNSTINSNIANISSNINDFKSCLCNVPVPPTCNKLLQIHDIDGESRYIEHEGWIDVQSFNWGLSVKIGGTGEPIVDVKDFSFRHVLDKASPKLMSACAEGRDVGDATLELWYTGETPAKFYELKMTHVMISSVNIAADASTYKPLEDVVLRFTKVEWKYWPRNPNGSMGSPISGSYDLTLK